MIAQERLQAITSLLAKQQKLTVHVLQRELKISPATLRRDLSELEAAGKVIRVRGAVVHPDYFRDEPTLTQRSRTEVKAKRAMAQSAVTLVPAGARVLVDAGSTCLEIGRLLLTRTDLTLLTHSLPLAMLTSPNGATVICLGGEVRPVSAAALGALGLSWMKNLRADIAFVGASGLSRTDGASTTDLVEAAMKTELLARASTRVVVADLSKWEKPTAVNFGAWNDFDYWVTDGKLSNVDSKAVRKAGTKVIAK